MTNAFSLTGVRRSAMWLAAMALLIAGCGQPDAPVTVSDPVYRPPLGAGSVGAAYLTIESASDDSVVSFSSPMAAAVEIHETVVENGRASMRPIGALELPAHTPVALEPGGMHLMIIDPQPIEVDQTFPLMIELESGVTLTVKSELSTP